MVLFIYLHLPYIQACIYKIVAPKNPFVCRIGLMGLHPLNSEFFQDGIGTFKKTPILGMV